MGYGRALCKCVRMLGLHPHDGPQDVYVCSSNNRRRLQWLDTSSRKHSSVVRTSIDFAGVNCSEWLVEMPGPGGDIPVKIVHQQLSEVKWNFGSLVLGLGEGRCSLTPRPILVCCGGFRSRTFFGAGLASGARWRGSCGLGRRVAWGCRSVRRG